MIFRFPIDNLYSHVIAQVRPAISPTPAYDSIPDDLDFPYVKVGPYIGGGEGLGEEGGIMKPELRIQIVSAADGFKEANTLANSVAAALPPPDNAIDIGDSFTLIERLFVAVEAVERFDEPLSRHVRHVVLRYSCWIQDEQHIS